MISVESVRDCHTLVHALVREKPSDENPTCTLSSRNKTRERKSAAAYRVRGERSLAGTDYGNPRCKNASTSMMHIDATIGITRERSRAFVTHASRSMKIYMYIVIRDHAYARTGKDNIHVGDGFMIFGTDIIFGAHFREVSP